MLFRSKDFIYDLLDPWRDEEEATIERLREAEAKAAAEKAAAVEARKKAAAAKAASEDSAERAEEQDG